MSLEPVYKVEKIKTAVTPVPWQGIDAIADAIQNGWAVLWQHHAVFTVQIQDGKVRWLRNQPEKGDEHFVRLRAFNKEQEYHFWRTGSQIKGRLRSDNSGQEAEYIDTQMVLRGVVANPLIELASSEFDKADYLSVKTRNYIDYHPKTQQAGYVDSRFVDFEDLKNK